MRRARSARPRRSGRRPPSSALRHPPEHHDAYGADDRGEEHDPPREGREQREQEADCRDEPGGAADDEELKRALLADAAWRAVRAPGDIGHVGSPEEAVPDTVAASRAACDHDARMEEASR